MRRLIMSAAIIMIFLIPSVVQAIQPLYIHRFKVFLEGEERFRFDVNEYDCKYSRLKVVVHKGGHELIAVPIIYIIDDFIERVGVRRVENVILVNYYGEERTFLYDELDEIYLAYHPYSAVQQYSFVSVMSPSHPFYDKDAIFSKDVYGIRAIRLEEFEFYNEE
jgi:hypothetical protein